MSGAGGAGAEAEGARRGLTFRARILLVVFAVGVAPVAVLGLWLVGGTARVGESLLRSRLEEALHQERQVLEAAWVPVRSALLDWAETPEVRSALASAAEGGLGGAADGSAGAPGPEAALPPPVPDVLGLALRDGAGRVSLRYGAQEVATGGPAPGGALRVELAVHDPLGEEATGHLAALVPFLALRPPIAAAAEAGGVLTAADPAGGALLLPVPFPPDLLGRERFEWNDRPWVVERVRVTEPDVVLVAAAPLEPFTAPFRATARWGTILLLGVTAGGMLLAAWLTDRLTSSLQRVTEAAEAVAAGDLERTLPRTRDDEVGRLAAAFNRMTRSLRETLDALAGRESLAAVNEFAATLAHEVRNPLTSIGLDLQEVEESLADGSPERSIQGRAIEDLRRLDRAVEGALDTARSGRVRLRRTDLLVSVRDGVRGVRPLAEESGVVLTGPPEHGTVPVRGDPEALERAVHNVVRNAVEASPRGEVVDVRVEAAPEGVLVRVRDRGEGIPSDVRERVFEPFFTTRPGGTGVGLAVTRRIVAAHRGRIEILDAPGGGTEVRIRIPGPDGSGTIRAARGAAAGTDRSTPGLGIDPSLET